MTDYEPRGPRSLHRKENLEPEPMVEPAQSERTEPEPEPQSKSRAKEHQMEVADLDVECDDGAVIVSIGHYHVRMTGGEAQKFSRDLAEAAMEAGF